MSAADDSSGTTPSGPEASGHRAPSAIGARPTRRELVGTALMALSYALGLPAVALLGALSLRMGEPLLAVIGVPSLLVVSHVTFAAGLYLAGGRRLAALVRRLRRPRPR